MQKNVLVDREGALISWDNASGCLSLTPAPFLSFYPQHIPSLCDRETTGQDASQNKTSLSVSLLYYIALNINTLNGRCFYLKMYLSVKTRIYVDYILHDAVNILCLKEEGRIACLTYPTGCAFTPSS